jgi:hypothetical protein
MTSEQAAEIYERFVGNLNPAEISVNGDWRQWICETYTAERIQQMFPDYDGTPEPAEVVAGIIEYVEEATDAEPA